MTLAVFFLKNNFSAYLMETYYSYFGDLHELTLRQEMQEITYIPALEFENKYGFK